MPATFWRGGSEDSAFLGTMVSAATLAVSAVLMRSAPRIPEASFFSPCSLTAQLGGGTWSLPANQAGRMALRCIQGDTSMVPSIVRTVALAGGLLLAPILVGQANAGHGGGMGHMGGMGGMGGMGH